MLYSSYGLPLLINSPWPDTISMITSTSTTMQICDQIHGILDKWNNFTIMI